MSQRKTLVEAQKQADLADLTLAKVAKDLIIVKAKSRLESQIWTSLKSKRIKQIKSKMKTLSGLSNPS